MPDFGQDFKNHISILEDVEGRESIEILVQEAKTANDDRARYAINLERWFKKRFGIRPQSVTWPWRNASNLHMPLTDKMIRRNKPTFADLQGVYPTVVLESNVLGDDQELIRGVERWFHNVLHDEDKTAIDLPLFWGIDMMMEKGRFIVKIVQEFTPFTKTEEVVIKNLSQELQDFLLNPARTDDELALELSLQYSLDLNNQNDITQIQLAIRQFRDGKDVITFQRKVNLTPFPSIFIRDPLTVLFPTDTPFLISKARWFRDRVALTIEDIEQRVEENIWDKANGEILLQRLKDVVKGRGRVTTGGLDALGQGVAGLERQREGISPTSSPVPFIDEFYHWRVMPGQRLAERMVLTIHPDHTDLPLRLIRHPYVQPDGKPEDWPFEQVQSEIVSDRAYAPRGYPQLLDSLQTATTNNHNAKQNWMTIANTLNLKVKRNSGVSTQWIPGQPLWVNRQDDAQTLNIAPRDLSFDNEERGLKQWADEYIGILDSTITNQTGTPERRTKAEVDAVGAIQAKVSSFDALIYQKLMQRVYKKIWNRVMQFGSDNISYLNGLGEVVSIPKKDVQTRFNPVPRGNIFNTNRQFVQAQLERIANLTAGSNMIDQFSLLQNIIMNVDERLARSILRRPEQVKQQQIERFIDDIFRIKEGYVVVPRADDENEIALAVVEDYLKDPIKRRNFPTDRLEVLSDFRAAHQLALKKKKQATTRGGRAEQEVAKVAQGERGREARS